MKKRYARLTSRQERSLMPRKKKLCSPHTCGSKADKVVMEGNEQFLLWSRREVMFYWMGLLERGLYVC